MGSGTFSGHMTPSQPGVKEQLDLKDRKILFELSRNARLSSAAIGRAVGLSREVVDYRIKQLTQRGILSGFVTIVDAKLLGYRKHIIYLRLENTTKEEEENIINKLVSEERIIWVATVTGEWDAGLLTASRTAQELSDTISIITRHCGGHMEEYLLLEEVHESYLGLGLLAEGLKQNPPPLDREGVAFQRQLAISSKEQPIALSETDKKVLRLLMLEPRIPLSALSARARLSAQTAKNSVKKLISAGVVRGFMPMISFYKLGCQWYMTWLRFNTFSDADDARLLQYSRQHPNILWYIRTIGHWHVQLSVFATDTAQYNEILDDIRSKFAHIQHSDTALVLNQYKYAHTV